MSDFPSAPKPSWHASELEPAPETSTPEDTGGEPARLAQTAAQLVPLFYADLRRLARRVRHESQASQTLQTTALIHEVYLKLRRVDGWNDRQHFMRASAMAMRQVLVDDVRARLAQRRGAGATHVSLDDAEVEQVAAADVDDRVVVIDDALRRLALLNPRLSQTVECRYFAGYNETETADALGVSLATVQRDWAKARAWLHRELGGLGSPAA
ncbi:MAG: ECF-type sigma factor [Rubrivivax sp.]|nr:sigma-70 family RNA polymerase sigma factor [Rubrivivax sp.]